MADDFAKWRGLLAGQKVPLHEDEPICGYFKMRDRRGLWANATAIKRPWIPCAIWRADGGELMAEIAGNPCAVTRIWPWCAKHPITHEAYAYWHQNERWPEEAA